MNKQPVQMTVLAVSLVMGLPWARSKSVVPPDAAPKTPAETTPATPAAGSAAATGAPDRVVLFTAGDPDYLALAIPASYKKAPGAPLRLLVFRGGLCVRDLGLADSQKKSDAGTPGTAVVEQSGTNERAFVAPDGRTAIVARTRYVSRVDVTPGTTSTLNDTVTGDTTLTLIDPAHPDGRWQVTLEDARWTKDVLVLPAEKGVVVTTFLPRDGPTDVRILDASGRESLRVPETAAETLRVEATPEGGHVAAEVIFRDNPKLPERGVMVFDLARGTHWTYGWRYGSDDEPLSWTLQSRGVLAVKLPRGTRRFDAGGRKL